MTFILAILQARISSSRLYGKVLKPILGKPMLEHQIDRVRQSHKINELIVATSNDPGDNEIETLCQKIKVPCYRGNLNNVLDRFYQSAKTYKPEHIVRITGDCPLIDPEIIDNVITYYFNNEFDYTSNALQPTFPDGLDVEIFRFSILEKAWKEATLPSQLEHVTPFIYNQPDQFNIGNYSNTENLSHMRWTVDEPEDFKFVTRIYEELYMTNPEFRMRDILALLQRNPELSMINCKFKRNEGMITSLNKDRKLINGKT